MEIKKIREKTGLSQAKFAEKYHIPKRTLEGWEAGRKVPGYIAEWLERLVDIDFSKK